MVEIGGYLDTLAYHENILSHGIDEFIIICLGYKGHVIKEYFAHYFMNMSDVTFDMKDGHMHTFDPGDSWKVTCVDTGKDTMTGGRIKRIREYIGDDLCLTYGDVVSDVDIKREIDFHKKGRKFCNNGGCLPNGRFDMCALKAAK